MTHIAHLDMQPWQQEYIIKKTNEQNLEITHHFFSEHEFTDEVIEQIQACSIVTVFVHTKTPKEIINRLPNLTLLITRSTGFDHIDCDACTKKCVTFKSVPGYGSNTVAEHGFALLLSMMKHIGTITRRTSQADFSYLDHIGFDLEGKTMAVLGAGRIGQNMIKIAKGFGMHVIAFDVYENHAAAEELGFTFHSLEYVLANADVLSLHLPLTEETKALLSLENLRKTKKGCFVINTARGDLFENSELITLLEEGVFAGVGLDCMEGEKDMFNGQLTPEQKTLLADPRVLFTPHNAYYTQEAVKRILDTTLSHITEFVISK